MKFKKLGSLLLAGCLAMSLATTAFAEWEMEETTDITITAPTGEVTSTYKAWRVLNLTTSLKTTDHPVSCTEGKHTEACYNYAYTVNGTYLSILQSLAPDSYTKGDATVATDTNNDGTKDAEEIIAYLGSMQSDSDEIRKFANDLYAAVKDMNADATSSGATFENAAQGYYLIAEATLATDDEGKPVPDSRSLVMLDTKGQTDITVESKEDLPIVQKKVKEENPNDDALTGGWQDSADWDIGDDVPFQLAAKLPNNIADYLNDYKFIFHDTLSANLSLNKDTVKVYVQGAELAAKWFTVSDVANNQFTVTIADVVDAAAAAGVAKTALSSSTVVTVEYTAKLLNTAVIGNHGQDNKVKLEFSNDPYVADSTSNTTEDVVTVFTYKTVVSKVDPAGNALAGANFKLQKWNGSAYVDYKTLEEDAAATTFTFTGLDRGQYKLVETKVPSGYNKADDLVFVIEPTMPTTADDPALSALVIKDADGNVISTGDTAKFTVGSDLGTISTKIENSTGLRLPSTGGMGTFLFYGAGALLVAAGGTLMGKKRKEDAEA